MTIESHQYQHGAIKTHIVRGTQGDVVITQGTQQIVLVHEEWEMIVRDFPVAAFQSPVKHHAHGFCPDDGTCNHLCSVGCFRVEFCGPLSGVYENDRWPKEVIEANTPSDGRM